MNYYSPLHLQQVCSRDSPWGCGRQADAGSRSGPASLV